MLDLIPIRRTLPVVLSLLVSSTAFAHAEMDLGVALDAPAFLPAGQTERVGVVASVQAYDPVSAVVITVETTAQFTGFSAPPSWQCTQEAQRVRCTADSLGPGPHPFAVDIAVPASGTVGVTAGILSTSSADPDPSDDGAAATSSVYAPASCVAQAPTILSAAMTAQAGFAEVSWSPAAGASRYELLAGTDGETPRRVVTTTGTRTGARLAGGGEITWIVRANFDGCPAVESAPSVMTSNAPAAQLEVRSVSSPLFVRPVSLAFAGGTLYIADAGAHRLLSHRPGSGRVVAEEIVGDIVTTPLGADGGIAFGPGNYLYLAEPSHEVVRYGQPTVPRQVFTLVGGLRAPGAVDGIGRAARLRAPRAVAVDDTSRVYVTDGGHTIRRAVYDATKGDFVLTTLAGTAGESGTADGTGSAARFNDPAGLVLDAEGHLLVADRGNHTIRRVTPAGEVTTLAGRPGEAGHRDGAKEQALFHRPMAVAVDDAGNILVTEEGNHTVRKIAPNGRVTTLAGLPGSAGHADGPGAAARFHTPAMLTIGADGTVWIADAGNGALRQATYAFPPAPRRRAARK